MRDLCSFCQQRRSQRHIIALNSGAVSSGLANTAPLLSSRQYCTVDKLSPSSNTRDKDACDPPSL